MSEIRYFSKIVLNNFSIEQNNSKNENCDYEILVLIKYFVLTDCVASSISSALFIYSLVFFFYPTKVKLRVFLYT